MPANYVLLQRVELNASAASVTFSNIPQSGYTDLKLVISGRLSNNPYSAAWADTQLYFNGSNTSLSNRDVAGSGSAANSNNGTNITIRMPSSGATANTFGNTEVYIPNYNSTSAYKSVSIDMVTENNATQSRTELIAGLWSSNSAITSITLLGIDSAQMVQYSTFSLYGLAAVGTTPVIAPKATGGNLIENDGTYWIHTFYSTGTFTPLQGLSCDYLVVAGGGAGGGDRGGGGGAGGYRAGSALSVATQAYTITVGAGGAGTTGNGSKGTNSIFSTITSTGGGYGASTGGGSPAGTGGSGGGGWGASAAASNDGGAGNEGGYSPVEGYAGGNGEDGDPRRGGGGGGSSAVGVAGASGGTGGAGTSSSITGTAVTRAGGGGGGAISGAGAGGSGGGGAGANSGSGTSGTTNTGSGGGGAGDAGAGRVGGNGGSGIVIIRYPIA